MRISAFKGVLLSLVIVWPHTLYACACCGLDNTWAQNNSPINEYTGEVLLGLDLAPGDFNDSPMYEKSYPVIALLKEKNAFIFRTRKGDIRFHYAGPVEHRMTDITFITNKKYKYSDEADIYHELILRGSLLIPEGVRNSFVSDQPSEKLQKSMAATMVFQGFGNACIEGPEFKKWLVKLDNQNINFQGNGSIKPKPVSQK